jgi:hypothetical protein
LSRPRRGGTWQPELQIGSEEEETCPPASFPQRLSANLLYHLGGPGAKIGRKTHYHWLENDSAYAAAFKQVQMIAGDALESVAVERAVMGWTEPVYFRGEKCDEMRRYDNAMLMFLLRALKPDMYGARVHVPAPAVAAPPAQPKVEVVFVDSAQAGAQVEEPAGRATVMAANAVDAPEVSEEEILRKMRAFLRKTA